MPPVPDEVKRFLLTSVPSVPYLEAALLFRRKPTCAYTLQEVAHALYIAERTAAELTAGLCAAGVLRQEGAAYCYSPRDTPLADMLDRVAEAHRSNLIGVTNLIHDATQKSAHRFADAFKLRKEK